MSTKFSAKSSRPSKQQLITGLDTIPAGWALTPVNGNKESYRKQWSTEAPLTVKQLIQEFNHGRAQGYGLRTGAISNGLIAIDVDGLAAEELLQQKSGGDLPETVVFTSGREGRRQMLYRVQPEFMDLVKTVKLKTGARDENGKEQQLEFRWDGCQSVLPPSTHPETGCYQWVKAPTDVEVAECPIWVIEFMIDYQTQPKVVATPARTLEEIKPVAYRRPPLEIFLGKADRKLVESGANNGNRNDSARKISLNLVATSRRLSELGIDFDGDARTLYDQFCARCNPPLGSDVKGENEGWWKNADSVAKHPSLDDDKLQACYEAWQRRSCSTKQERVLVGVGSVKTSTVNTVGALRVHQFDGRETTPANWFTDSQHSVNTQDTYTSKLSATVNTVNKILKMGLPDYEEEHQLEQVLSNSGMKRAPFKKLVASCRGGLDDVLPEDELRLKTLIDWRHSQLDFKKALPSMARDILHDADVLNIDPIVIWQALFPAVLSLAGRKIDLDIVSHKIPSIAWTLTLLETGGGKSRADKMVLGYFKDKQHQEKKRYEAEVKELKEWKESGDDSTNKPEIFAERKYLFEVATIQAVLKRLSEQSLNGSLWARDEFAGLFKSFGQFSKNGVSEALEILLKLWDGDFVTNDRVLQEDSFSIANTALSLTGGIQPDIFQAIFPDPKDSQGLLARFLLAKPQTRKPVRTFGHCYLSEKLPSLYAWVEQLNATTIKLSKAADRYYTKIYNEIGEQAWSTPSGAIRAWMFKLPTHVLRIAMALHIIECYYDQNRPVGVLQKETLERAVLFAQYYRSSFHVIQETATHSDDMSSILLKIYDAAAKKHPDGLTPRDAYRNIRALVNRAKESGRDAGAYTVELFYKLEEMGKGTVVKNNRNVKFVAYLFDPDTSTTKYEKSEYTDDVDTLTEAENTTGQQQEVSTQSQVSAPSVGEENLEDVKKTDELSVLQKNQSESISEETAPGSDEQPVSVTSEVKEESAPQNNQPVIETEETSQFVSAPATVDGSNSPDADSNELAPCLEKFSLLQVELDGDVNAFVGCDVEVHTINGAVKFQGELISYDQLNGSVTIKTESGACYTAHVRETFVI
ncbi:Primase 2 (plasmid) [Calothrix sp. NIES-4071]|nr:Primase 2 [Calothrix sp. NIES-4071]BAZ64767.1 Primase 2 [Calothrix sp. NIES-4105]